MAGRAAPAPRRRHPRGGRSCLDFLRADGPNMAPGRWRQGRRFFRALLLAALLGPAACFSSSFYSPGEPRSSVRVLCGSNWSLVLQGQWMLEL